MSFSVSIAEGRFFLQTCAFQDRATALQRTGGGDVDPTLVFVTYQHWPPLGSICRTYQTIVFHLLNDPGGTVVANP